MIHYSISSRKSKLFEIERNKAQGEDFRQLDEKEAEILLNPWKARKQFMLPKGKFAIMF